MLRRVRGNGLLAPRFTAQVDKLRLSQSRLKFWILRVRSYGRHRQGWSGANPLPEQISLSTKNRLRSGFVSKCWIQCIKRGTKLSLV